MTRLPIEWPELPEEFGDSLIAVVIIVVATLGAFAALLEAKADDREAAADRGARVAMLEAVASNLDRAGSKAVREIVGGREHAWRAAGHAAREVERGETLNFARVHESATRRAADATRADATLAAAAREDQATLRFYEQDEIARAYERERDSHTAQVTRFVAVIADFAVALLLLGLFARLPHGIRRYFVLVTAAGAAVTSFWAGYIWLDHEPPPNRAAIARFAAGRLALDRDSTAAAIRHFTAALAADSNYASARIYRARARNAAGEFVTARAELVRATSLDGDDFLAWNELAVSYWWSGLYEDALEAIEHAADLNPDDPTVAFNRLEGLAAVSGRSPEYVAQLETLARVLRTRGADPATNLRLDIADTRDSAQNDERIALRMHELCVDLQAIAEDMGVTDDVGECLPPPKPRRAK